MPSPPDNRQTSALESFFYQYVYPRLPIDAQALFQEPPNLANPASFLPLFRLVAPYIGYLITLIAFFIIWSMMTSIVSYFSRFFRFALRLIPVIAFTAWVMASSDQGTAEELFGLVKQWAGLGSGDNKKEASPGIETLAGLFGVKQRESRSTRRSGSTGRSTSPYLARSKGEPVASRTRGKTAGKADDQGSDLLSALINSAIGSNPQPAKGNPWQAMVQDYVKQSVMKASGLDWLLGNKPEKDEKKGRIWTR